MKFFLALLVVLSLLLVGCQQPAATSSSGPPTSPPNSSQTTQPGTNSTGTSPAVPTSIPTSLSRLQLNAHLAVAFSALTTFEVGNNTGLTFATVYEVPPVPIAWTGTSFKGELEEKGPGEDITDLVNGTVSSDGGTLVSLIYSRQIIRPTLKTGNFFRLTLANVPIASLVNGSVTGLGTFESSGALLQNLVTKIEYMDGPLSNGQIASTTNYVSTDWTNPQPGQAPHLKINFSP